MQSSWLHRTNNVGVSHPAPRTLTTRVARTMSSTAALRRAALGGPLRAAREHEFNLDPIWPTVMHAARWSAPLKAASLVVRRRADRTAHRDRARWPRPVETVITVPAD